MKENHLTTHGEYVDRGGNRHDKQPSAGNVLINKKATKAAYTDQEVTAIIRQGRENPRRLTLEESRLANKNRTKANEDLRAMEAWAAAEL